ncbi:GNAT family N-acetyltransferase [Pseudoalteromonas piscicida]|uniref:GNAT family N-acetyltransferase n=1 Tax=Pseudoalteromonas piscicida TaxID=43662 RepID=A0A2A5JU28_PSEO7|nr:GNAT family N-acetyltransferase [Pseudoalteromonas piscicida]PCK32925.1 GNAT family N-acetyltransferase [Pseudoalteromonas piscicida]
MEIVKLGRNTPSLAELIAEIDSLMNDLYPAQSNQLSALSELCSADAHFIGVIKNQEIVACGAVVKKQHDCLYAELKRLYVKPNYRGQGLSKIIMSELIAFAKAHQYSVIRLETGVKQPEALGLYAQFNFVERRAFGHYQCDPFSVYMELQLENNREGEVLVQ